MTFINSYVWPVPLPDNEDLKNIDPTLKLSLESSEVLEIAQDRSRWRKLVRSVEGGPVTTKVGKDNKERARDKGRHQKFRKIQTQCVNLVPTQ